AAWGVDYLKYDWCNTTTQDAQAAYALIRNALNATGRPIVLSICEWGTAKPWLWGEKVGGNLWRTTGDISDMWQSKDKHHLGVVDILDLQDGSRSVVLLNRDTSQREIAVSWEEIGYPSHLGAGVRDLWRGKDLGQFKEKYSASVAPHSVVMVRVAP